MSGAGEGAAAEGRAPALLLVLALLLPPAAASAANVAGGGSGAGPDVTVTTNGDGTMTLANGLVAIVIDTRRARLDSVAYTHRNHGAPATTEMLKGKGQFWYGGFMLGDHAYTAALATDPAASGGDLGDVALTSSSATNGVIEIHYALPRGAQGFYATAIQTHRHQDAAFEVGAWGFLCRVPASFQWVTVDPLRNFSLGAMGSQRGVRVPDSPHEILLLTDGDQQGEFDDKFIYGLDNGARRAWGWSSVGPGGLNVGAWLMNNQMEFSNGGPLKRDVAASHDHGLNNPIMTGEVGMGSDGFLVDGEIWTKTCGPCFYYVNEVPAAISDPREAAQRLYADALAQAGAEERAWPYRWFKHPGYVPAAGRGAVSGRFTIDDRGAPGASAAGLWVGLEQQPRSSMGTFDFQKYSKSYQFWVQTDAAGDFTIPNVIAGAGYTLWAFGPGAAGTFMSQQQVGGAPPLLVTVPERPFSVTVTAGEETRLGTVTWAPTRVGATVFELGRPDRHADDFRHGEDYWAPARAPKLGFPTPVWGGQVQFPLDFPEGLTYIVGSGRWTTGWNYVLPSAPDATGAYQPCTGTIAFDLAQAPAPGALASLYLGCAGDAGGRITIDVNGVALAGAPGVTAAPAALTPTGYDPPYQDDSSIHFSDHGPFSDERLGFPGALLRAGRNTIAIGMNARSGVAYLMVDYLRLELTGYVPPAPAGVSAAAGNHRVLVRWPVVPGATSYRVERSTGGGAAFAPLASGVAGPVCGSGPALGAYTDATAVDGTAYAYRVLAVNPTGASAPSAPSPAATPSAALATTAPPAPAGLRVTASGHHLVALTWSAAPGAVSYSVWRTTLHRDGVGGDYGLRTIVLEDAVADTTYVDNSPTDGSLYRYHVQADSAAGTSTASAAVRVQPLPAPPTSAPRDLVATWTKTRKGEAITLAWSKVPGATGYVIYRSGGGETAFRWPEAFLATLVETTYTDHGSVDKAAGALGLDAARAYAYQVTAVNAGGISPPSAVSVPAR